MQHTKPPRKPLRFLRNSLPFWLILPTVIFLFVVQVYPALYTVWLSLQERQPSGWTFVGLKNFDRLFNMSIFGESAGHTIIFLVSHVILTMVGAFIIAFLLSRKIRFTGFYITVLFIPWIIAQIIVGLVFRLLVAPDYGLLAGLLQNPDLFPPNGLSVLTASRPLPWFGEFPFPPSPAMILLIIASTWRAIPFVTLLLLGAIEMVPGEVLESAMIDGASLWQSIRYIMIPLILPTIIVSILSLTLNAMNGVGLIFSLTDGGPGTSTNILSFTLYTIGWGQLQFGRAAALALIMAVINWILIAGILRNNSSEGETN
ncbi:MAG: sugar ABC transporter permease [Anaerolineae bacterium]|nr:sugar ABC transporter permease [Anaerolineae bacterium]